MAETELSVLSGQCLDRRIDEVDFLIREVEAWESDRNLREAKVRWRFTTEDARIKLEKLYPVFEYPDAWELTAAQRAALERSAELAAVAERVGRGLPDDGSRPGDGRTLYHRWLGAAPGTKVGGYPDWVQDPAYPTCEFCGVGMAPR